MTGIELRRCSCGAAETREISALLHDYGEAWLYDETSHCRACIRCGEQLSEGEHVFAYETIAEATEEADGQRLAKCLICGAEFMQGIPKIEHDFGAWQQVTEPRCDVEGLEQRICANCGKIEERALPKTKHDFQYFEQQPTATEDGFQRWTCELCGYVQEIMLPSLG